MEIDPAVEFPKKKNWKNQISGNTKFQVEEKQKNPGKKFKNLRKKPNF